MCATLVRPETGFTMDPGPIPYVRDSQEEEDAMRLRVLKRKFMLKKLDGYMKRPKSSYIRFG